MLAGFLQEQVTCWNVRHQTRLLELNQRFKLSRITAAPFCFSCLMFGFCLFLMGCLANWRSCFFRVRGRVLPVVPRRADPGQPGPAHGLGPESGPGQHGRSVPAEVLRRRQSAGHAQRNTSPGQLTPATPFLLLWPPVGGATLSLRAFISSGFPCSSSNYSQHLDLSNQFWFWNRLAHCSSSGQKETACGKPARKCSCHDIMKL